MGVILIAQITNRPTGMERDQFPRNPRSRINRIQWGNKMRSHEAAERERISLSLQGGKCVKEFCVGQGKLGSFTWRPVGGRENSDLQTEKVTARSWESEVPTLGVIMEHWDSVIAKPRAEIELESGFLVGQGKLKRNRPPLLWKQQQNGLEESHVKN